PSSSSSSVRGGDTGTICALLDHLDLSSLQQTVVHRNRIVATIRVGELDVRESLGMASELVTLDGHSSHRSTSVEVRLQFDCSTAVVHISDVDRAGVSLGLLLRCESDHGSSPFVVLRLVHPALDPLNLLQCLLFCCDLVHFALKLLLGGHFSSRRVVDGAHLEREEETRDMLGDRKEASSQRRASPICLLKAVEGYL
ncbi:hypothetical protein PMAYCL1PPCAC_19023, partial [Pristionchus mayeri]